MDIFSIKSFPHKFPFTVSLRNFQSLKNSPMFSKELSLKYFPYNSLFTVSRRIIIVIEFTLHHFPKEFPITIYPRIPPLPIPHEFTLTEWKPAWRKMKAWKIIAKVFFIYKLIVEKRHSLLLTITVKSLFQWFIIYRFPISFP